jgi:acyl-CoA thioester hydrolase
MRVKIYYHHTDCGGVVYYARYLEFLEEARTEFLEQRGILIKELIKQGIVFAISHQEIDYKSPAFYGDTLQIETQLTKISGVRLEFEYEIKNQSGKLIATAGTVMACMSSTFKPKPIPEEVRKKLLK